MPKAFSWTSRHACLHLEYKQACLPTFGMEQRNLYYLSGSFCFLAQAVLFCVFVLIFSRCCAKAVMPLRLREKFFVARSVLRQLETQTNIYLEQASGGLLRLDFASSRTARMNKVLSVRGFDGAFRQATRCTCSSSQPPRMVFRHAVLLK